MKKFKDYEKSGKTIIILACCLFISTCLAIVSGDDPTPEEITFANRKAADQEKYWMRVEQKAKFSYFGNDIALWDEYKGATKSSPRSLINGTAKLFDAMGNMSSHRFACTFGGDGEMDHFEMFERG